MTRNKPLRRIGESSRKANTKVPNKVIVILCEGETEKGYFSNFKPRKVAVDVRCIQSKYTNPNGIVEEAIRYAKKQDLNLKDNYNELWCVYDLDTTTTNEKIQDTARIARKNHIQLALSNPTFEIWFLLHFEPSPRCTQSGKVLTKIKKYVPSYKKGDCVYGKISTRTDDAITNAKRLEQRHQQSLDAGDFKCSVPYTGVHHLVAKLRSISGV